MRYITYWKNSTDVKTLSFDIFDNPVAKSWAEVVQKKLKAGDREPKGYSNHGVFPSRESRKDIAQELAKHVAIARTYRPELEWPDDIYSIDQEQLNYLHERFHETEEKMFRSIYGPLEVPEELQPIKDAFIQINHLIHSLERIIHWENLPEKFKKNRQSYYVLNFGTYDTELFNPVTEGMRKYFKHHYYPNQKDAHLILGYNTIGKNLHHCANDDDRQVVKDGMVRPQMHIGSEAILIVKYGWWAKEKESVDRQNEKEILNIKSFIDEHKLHDYIDWKSPRHLYGVQPQIGVVSDDHDDWTEDNYYDLVTNYTLWRVDLL